MLNNYINNVILIQTSNISLDIKMETRIKSMDDAVNCSMVNFFTLYNLNLGVVTCMMKLMPPRVTGPQPVEV